MNFQNAAAISRAASIRLVSDLPVLPNPAGASVAVIGLGYVGLPLLAGFAKGGHAVGFDIDERKLNALRHGEDTTGQVSGADLAHENIEFTSAASALKDADVIVVCVPTPVNHANRPVPTLIDVNAAASNSLGSILLKTTCVDILIFCCN